MEKEIWYWHIHHDVLVGKLLEPITNRIEYIKSNKPKNEIETRLRLMKPASGVAPALEQYKKIQAQAWEQYEKIKTQAWEQYKKIKTQAWEQYEKIQTQAWEQYEKIQAPALEQYKKIQAQAWEQYKKVIEKLHEKQCGCKEWNDKEIVFPR